MRQCSGAMGAMDRRARKGLRKASWVQPSSPKDSASSGRRPSAGSCSCSSSDSGSMTMAQLERKLEAGSRSGKSVESHDAAWQRMAQLPSPLRSCGHGYADGIANSPASAAASPGSYRDQLRAKGQQVLQLSHGAEIMPRSPHLPPCGGAEITARSPTLSSCGGAEIMTRSPPPPPSAPPSLGFSMTTEASHPPPPPTADAILGNDSSPTSSPGCPEKSVSVMHNNVDQTPRAPVLVAMAPLLATSCDVQAASVLNMSPMNTSSMDGLMPSAMPQFDRDELAALLRAAEPARYED